MKVSWNFVCISYKTSKRSVHKHLLIFSAYLLLEDFNIIEQIYCLYGQNFFYSYNRFSQYYDVLFEQIQVFQYNQFIQYHLILAICFYFKFKNSKLICLFKKKLRNLSLKLIKTFKIKKNIFQWVKLPWIILK